MKSKEKESIDKMVEHIDIILEYTNNYSFDNFCNDSKTKDATILNIIQIGELVKNISNETKEKYYNIEWNAIKSLRNRMVHDYPGINLKNIWFIVKNDLKLLKEDLEDIKKTD